MVMRCVLKHHVCLCVLSTAVLAGLTLITAQTKVYAQSQNCNGIANSRATGVPGDPSGDSPKGKIECDGSRVGGKGGNGDRNGQLGGERTIDMKDEPSKPAVKVYNRADITITSGKLTITDKGKSNTGPAIQVDKQGKLTLAGNVDIKDVKKGIVADGKGSSVTVLKGSIGVRAGGGYVIGVKDGGEATLIKGVKVNGGGNNTGIEVGGTGGTVTLMGTNFTRVRNGIVFMGDKGKANVSGGAGGATISLVNGGTGVIMQGKGGANATVINMTITGSGGVGAEMMGDGALMLNTVTIEGVGVGARVSNGKLTVMGGGIQGNTMGVEVSEKGVLKVMGEATIVGTTMGLRVAGGSATMMGGSIGGGGSGGSYGVIVNTSGTVELSGGVEVSRFETGVSMTKWDV